MSVASGSASLLANPACDSVVTPLLLDRYTRYRALAPDTLAPCYPLPGTCTRYSRNLLPATTQNSHPILPPLPALPGTTRNLYSLLATRMSQQLTLTHSDVAAALDSYHTQAIIRAGRSSREDDRERHSLARRCGSAGCCTGSHPQQIATTSHPILPATRYPALLAPDALFTLSLISLLATRRSHPMLATRYPLPRTHGPVLLAPSVERLCTHSEHDCM